MNAPLPDTESLMWITARPDLLFVEGQGSWITDHRGKRYLDFVQGWAVNCLGHCPPQVVRALTEQSARLINPSPAYFNAPSARLARMLTDSSCFDRVFFASTGAEANEGAIKLARKWGRKHREGAFEIITFTGSFHGRTLATMSASGKPGWHELFAPQVPGFPKATLNDIDSVRALIGKKTVAVMLEPVQGEGGVIPAHPEFQRALRDLTKAEGLLLIVDEVQTGMGRTGKLFAYEHAGIAPDIMTLGKGIGGGVPLAALLATLSTCCFEAGDQGGTYNGNPLMTAVGVAVLEVIREPAFLDRVARTGDYLADRLVRLASDTGHQGERGSGLLRALILSDERGAAVVEAARNLAPEGLLVNSPRPEVIRFMPALNVSEDEIDRMLTMLRPLLE